MKRLFCVLFIVAVALAGLPSRAQQTSDPHGAVFMGGDKPPKKEKTATSRTVKGTVTDEFGKPLESAAVTLTNEGTHESLTYFTKKDGTYYFDGLSLTTDYKLVAQFKEGKSIAKTLSQYDHSPRIVRILEVDQPASRTPNAASAAKK
jgi:carboxypeptidase family protein